VGHIGHDDGTVRDSDARRLGRLCLSTAGKAGPSHGAPLCFARNASTSASSFALPPRAARKPSMAMTDSLVRRPGPARTETAVKVDRIRPPGCRPRPAYKLLDGHMRGREISGAWPDPVPILSRSSAVSTQIFEFGLVWPPAWPHAPHHQESCAGLLCKHVWDGFQVGPGEIVPIAANAHSCTRCGKRGGCRRARYAAERRREESAQVKGPSGNVLPHGAAQGPLPSPPGNERATRPAQAYAL